MKYIISLGGSILVPDKIDVKFIKQFVRLITRETKKGSVFHIVVGGGKTCRVYQQAAQAIIDTNFSAEKNVATDLDWLGIAATRLNAELLRVVFAGNKKVKIYSGEKPGASTDRIAVWTAVRNRIYAVANLSNIDFVYTADPRKNKNARRIEKMTWREFEKQFGRKWRPGANYPFDPIAGQAAKKSKLRVAVMNGRKLKNFHAYLRGKKFAGTIIG